METVIPLFCQVPGCSVIEIWIKLQYHALVHGIKSFKIPASSATNTQSVFQQKFLLELFNIHKATYKTRIVQKSV